MKSLDILKHPDTSEVAAWLYSERERATLYKVNRSDSVREMCEYKEMEENWHNCSNLFESSTILNQKAKSAQLFFLIILSAEWWLYCSLQLILYFSLTARIRVPLNTKGSLLLSVELVCSPIDSKIAVFKLQRGREDQALLLHLGSLHFSFLERYWRKEYGEERALYSSPTPPIKAPGNKK